MESRERVVPAPVKAAINELKTELERMRPPRFAQGKAPSSTELKERISLNNLRKIKTNEAKKSFRRNFLRELRPDRIVGNLGSDVVDYFDYVDGENKELLFETLQEILDDACKQTLLERMRSAVPDFTNLFFYINNINRLKNDPNEEDERLLARGRRFVKEEMFPGFGLLLRMYENVGRYPLFIGWFIQRVLMGIFLTIGTLVSGIRFIPAIIRLIPAVLMTLHIGKPLTDKAKTLVVQKGLDDSALFNHLSTLMIEFADRDDNELSPSELEEEISRIRLVGIVFLFASQQMAGIPLLEVMLSAYYERLTRELPKGGFGAIGSIIARPFEFVIAVVLLTAATGVEILNALVNAARYIVAISALLGATVASFALNSLLFLYDAPEYLMSKCCGRSPEEPEERVEVLSQKGPSSTHSRVRGLTADAEFSSPRGPAAANANLLPITRGGGNRGPAAREYSAGATAWKQPPGAGLSRGGARILPTLTRTQAQEQSSSEERCELNETRSVSVTSSSGLNNSPLQAGEVRRFLGATLVDGKPNLTWNHSAPPADSQASFASFSFLTHQQPHRVSTENAAAARLTTSHTARAPFS